MLKTVLFDLDGVLVDSHFLHYKSWKMLAEYLNLKLTETQADAFRGMAREECMRVMFEKFNNQTAPNIEEIDRLTTMKNNWYLEILNNANPSDLIIDGAVELLEELKSKNIKCLIASGSKNAKQVINCAKLNSYFYDVIDRHAIKITKPNPEIFLLALERASAEKNEAVGVEDALLGIESLKAAGIKSVGIGHYATTADLHLSSIKNLNYNVLCSILK